MTEAGIEPSLGSRGDSYDDALAESVIGCFKAEVIHRLGPWKDFEDVEFATLDRVAFYTRLPGDRCLKHVGREGTVHADRGAVMTSKPVALLLADLGVTKTHSRPHVSNDNPFSESQFKTVKYRPDFPDRFGSLDHGRSFCGDFFPWYNTKHYHVGLGLFTPHDVHYELAEAKRDQRAVVLAEAFARNPERFPNGRPVPRPLPIAVWINPPKTLIAGEEAENAMTPESNPITIGAVRSALEADLDHQRPGILSGSFWVSDVRSPLNGLRDDALLAHALRRLAAYVLVGRARWAQCVRAKAQSWEVRDERLDWPDSELTHIRLHRTIYYSVGGRRITGEKNDSSESSCGTCFLHQRYFVHRGSDSCS